MVDKSAFLLQKELKIKCLEDYLLEILFEHPKGISLAQIPQNLEQKVQNIVQF
jgi:uncharacterized protein YpbB